MGERLLSGAAFVVLPSLSFELTVQTETVGRRKWLRVPQSSSAKFRKCQPRRKGARTRTLRSAHLSDESVNFDCRSVCV